MTKINCASDLGFSLAGVSTYYAPNQFPASGTASPTNRPGSVTTPASGSVFTYTNGGDKVAYTITAAPLLSRDGSGGSGGSGAQTTGSKKSAAKQLRSSYWLAVGLSLFTLLL